jgi:8-oxo-dGTP pyrophosphatase MutT (NUDIX family)
VPKGNAIAAAALAAAGRSGNGANGALSPLVASYSQDYSVNRPYSPLPRPANVFLEGTFGPMQPITAMPINTPREDTQRPDPRRFQAEVGYNLPSGVPGNEGYKLTSFATLRSLADTYSVARSCVDKRKHEILGLDWDIVPTDEAEQALMGDESARADWEKRRAVVKEFFAHPDSDRAKYPTFGSWLSALLEDRFVIDAVAVHLVPPRKKNAGPFGSDLASLDLLDGSTIKPLLDINASTPRLSAVSYQQYLWGVPRVDMLTVLTEDEQDELGEPIADFRSDQLVYMRETPRDMSPYGFSCIEKALLPISIGLARQQYQQAYFSDGSIPGMFLTPGPDISTPQQIRQLQDALNAAVDLGMKHRILVLPPGSKADPMKPVPLADQFDEWIISQVAMPFGLTPIDLGVTPRVSAVQTPSESRELSQINQDKGSQTRIEPVCADLKSVVFDHVIQQVFKQKDMQWSWGLTDRGKNRQLLIDQGVELVKVGGKTLDELRIDLGDTPYGLPESSVPLIYTATGAMPLQAAAPEQALPGAQQAALPAGQQAPQQQLTDDDLTTPAHEAARALPQTTGSAPKTAPAGVQSADAQKQAAELEILDRYLRKGRNLARFRPEALPAEAVEAAARMLPQGIPAAVKAARDTADAKRRQDRRDRHLEAAAATVAVRLGQLVRDHKHASLSLPHLVDGGVAVMADGYRQAMTAGSQDASGDYEDTPALDDSDVESGARDAAEEQRGYLTGLLQDVVGGLSAAMIGARLALYASTLYKAYNASYGDTVMTAHPTYEIIWELGDARDHCRNCVNRAGKSFTVESLPGWPGDGPFGGSICLGGPNCKCSCRFVQGSQTVSVGTNTQLDWSGQYYDQQNREITAARRQAAAERADFVASLPEGPAIRAATRDDLRRQVADLANQRIRQSGGYPGVSVEPQDIPASIIARMLPPGLEGAAGLSEPQINVAQAVEEMFAVKALDGPAVDANVVYDQLAANYRLEGIGWVRDMTWTGPQQIPLDRIDWDHLDAWSAAHDDTRVADFEHRIQAGGHVNPIVTVQVPGDPLLKVIDGHHRALGYKRLGRPAVAYVGHADTDRVTDVWWRTHLYQVHQGGVALNKRAKISKASVNYRAAADPARSCGACVMFHEGGTCDLVAGQIDADATCDRFEPRRGASKGTGPSEDPTRVAFLLMRAPNASGKPRFLLQKRDDDAPNGGTWGLPGGKTHVGESPWDAAVREAAEELGDLPAVKPAAVWSRAEDDRVVWTFLVDLPRMFTPDGGDVETAGYGWFKRKDVADLLLQPAFRKTWEAFDFDNDRLGGKEPDVVKAARGYELNPRSGMISLDLPDGLIDPIPGGVNDFHVTICYLGGDVDDDAFAIACARAERAAASASGPLTGVVSGRGTFEPSDSSDDKTVVWAGVTLPGAQQIRAALEDLSASEHVDWKPHVTRAYIDAGDDLPDPLPAIPATFTHLSVHRGDDEIVRFPLGGDLAGTERRG